MPSASSLATIELCAHGALPTQLVDLGHDNDPQILRYLDLRRGPANWRAPVVVESNGQPCVHVFDGRSGWGEPDLNQWCQRVALRGDGAWVGVLDPGRLTIVRADQVGDQIRPVRHTVARPDQLILPSLINDLSAGQSDIARRTFLIRLLNASAKNANSLGLSQHDSLSLIGRGLFWRFLVDRGVLSGHEPAQVCASARTWEQCLDDKGRAIETFAWLDATFNGGLLPFSAPVDKFDDELFTHVLGNIAHGATDAGQLRLPTDWREINFAFIPVGLLSEVYESFAHDIDRQSARESSVHYTPPQIAEFVVRQSMAQLPESDRPRVLDPAAGAGVFLTTAFRQLVAREWAATGHRPGRKAIRRILKSQITGFDIDARALRLAELGLYLTALELDPDPRPLAELKFDALQGKVLYSMPLSSQGSLGPMEERFRGRFDVVLGNPPWSAVTDNRSSKRSWVDDSREIVSERLGAERAASFDLPDANPDMAFLWRAMVWARPGGRIALVMHARWLFSLSQAGQRARQDIFQALRVTGVLNGAALRKTHVWPGITATWCMVFAENSKPSGAAREAFHFISPMLDEARDSRQTRIRFDWQDAQAVPVAEVLKTPWALKMRFRGDRAVAASMAALLQRGEPLADCLQRSAGTSLKTGYQVGGSARKQKDSSAFLGLPHTRDSDALGFVVDASQLPRFERSTLLHTRDPEIYRAPLLLIRESIPVDPWEPRASRADEDLMFHASYRGISFADSIDGAMWCRYIQLVIQSSLLPFSMLMLDGRFGVEREAVHQEALERMPVVPLNRLSGSSRQRLQSLSDQLTGSMTAELAAAIDEFVFDSLELTRNDRQAIGDLLETGTTLTTAKQRALTPPSPAECERFVAVLASSLQNVAEASNLQVQVMLRDDLSRSPWRIMQISFTPTPHRPNHVPMPWPDFLECADANGASLVRVRANATTWFIGQIDRYRLWTPTRARLLAGDLLAVHTGG